MPIKQKPKKTKTKPADEGKLNPRQRRFVDEYLIDLNGTQAAIRAGYSEKTARMIATEILAKPYIQEEIERRMKARQERTEITQDMVLRRWWDIATADPNELVQFQRVCCRHCHGIDHAYQWKSEDEFERAIISAHLNKQVPPTDDGGYGFNPKRDPHPDCPECHGDGHGQVHAADTRKLAGGARLLYDGVKTTRDGFEIKMQDRSKALEAVAKHLGMFKEKVELTGPNGSPLQVATVDPSKLSTETLAEIMAARDAAERG